MVQAREKARTVEALFAPQCIVSAEAEESMVDVLQCNDIPRIKNCDPLLSESEQRSFRAVLTSRYLKNDLGRKGMQSSHVVEGEHCGLWIGVNEYQSV